MSDLGFDPSLKKKKKSKKAEDAPAASAAASAPADMDEMFAGLKKKKKSKKTGEDADESAAASSPGTASVDDLGESLGDLGLKKKEEEVGETGPYNRFRPYLAGDRSGPKFKIPPPVCQREGSKKTLFANVQDIATVLQRNPEHLIQFLFAELGTSGSIDGEKRLVLKGKFQPKQMESVLRRYIIEYVTCKTCKSMNTELKRESANRLHFLSCKACGSTRSVSSIKTGFQAQIGRRKRV
ncbi:hypothetical protein OXX80_007255 [Metschnikowia pulcherrima]